MKEAPWYKRYPANFIAGTVGLSLEEKGAYSLVLDLIYDRRGPVPDDAHFLAGICGCSTRKWNIIRGRLLALGKLALVDGGLMNRKAEHELAKAAEKAQERSESGRKGGDKSAENRAKLGDKSSENQANSNGNKELSQAKLKHARAEQMTDDRYNPQPPVGGRRRKRADEGYGDVAHPVFADFQNRIWSKRWERPNNPPLPAYRAYSKLSDADRAACGAAIERCARAIAAEASEPRYRPMLATWLNAHGWEAEAVLPAPALNWSQCMVYFRQTNEWPTGWGPRPGEPGCRVPRELVVAQAG